MNIKDQINIYEFMNQSGDPSHYICWGHVDSERFREECFKEFSVRPMVIQHRWERTKRVVQQKKKQKRFKTRIDSIQCQADDQNAKAVTIGLVPKNLHPDNPRDIEIN